MQPSAEFTSRIDARHREADVHSVPSPQRQIFAHAASMSPSPLVRPDTRRRSWDGERIINVILASLLLVALAPLMLLTALLVRLDDGGPIFFAHRRVGRDGRSFPCMKFRSMAVDAKERLERLLAESPEARAEWALDHKLRNDPRITRIGAFLRKTSLDELPQLFNVLRGEMSLVGPRPIVAEEGARYGRYFIHYQSVRPGITGLWQVSGRNDLSYRRRVAIDTAYVRSKSLGLDAWILVATVPVVIFRRGSY
jgi:exopolysaccharide production protein ExoY